MHALDSVPTGFARVPLKFGPYSSSKLQVARCPERFRCKYILRDKIVSDTIASSRGSAIHLILQRITEARIAGITISSINIDQWISEAMGIFPAAYAQIDMVKRAASAYIGNPSPYLAPATHCEIALAVSLYEEESFLDETVPAVAYVKAPVVPDKGGRSTNPDAYFAVKLDQLAIDELTRTVTILDHKSTPSASQNADHIFQMGCYAWMASLFYPGYGIRTVIHYANPELNFYAPPIVWTDGDIADIADEIRTRIFAIESFQEYPTIPGAHCDYCHMSQVCPDLRAIEQQNARGTVDLNVRGVDDLTRLAKYVRVLGVAYDQVNSTLKKGIETHCPTSGVAIGGMWYGFKGSEKKVDWLATEMEIKNRVIKAKQLLTDSNMSPETKAGLEAVIAAGDLEGLLKRHQINPEAFKQWKGDKLKALFKTDKQDLLRELNQFLVYDKDTRFGGYKI